MESFTGKPVEQSSSSKLILGIMLVGLLLIGGGVAYLLTRESPPVQEIKLDNALRDGAEFEELKKRIKVEPDLDYTTQSTSTSGNLSMVLAGKVRNFSGQTLTGLEVVGSVVNQKGEVLKSKKLIAIPTQIAPLGNNKVSPIRLEIAGFDAKDDRANIKWEISAIRVE